MATSSVELVVCGTRGSPDVLPLAFPVLGVPGKEWGRPGEGRPGNLGADINRAPYPAPTQEEPA